MAGFNLFIVKQTREQTGRLIVKKKCLNLRIEETSL